MHNNEEMVKKNKKVIQDLTKWKKIFSKYLSDFNVQDNVQGKQIAQYGQKMVETCKNLKFIPQSKLQTIKQYISELPEMYSKHHASDNDDNDCSSRTDPAIQIDINKTNNNQESCESVNHASDNDCSDADGMQTDINKTNNSDNSQKNCVSINGKAQLSQSKSHQNDNSVSTSSSPNIQFCNNLPTVASIQTIYHGSNQSVNHQIPIENSFSSLSIHHQKSSQNHAYCGACGNQFSNIKAMKDHWKQQCKIDATHSNYLEFQCRFPFCSAKFGNAPLKVSHERSKHAKDFRKKKMPMACNRRTYHKDNVHFDTCSGEIYAAYKSRRTNFPYVFRCFKCHREMTPKNQEDIKMIKESIYTEKEIDEMNKKLYPQIGQSAQTQKTTIQHAGHGVGQQIYNNELVLPNHFSPQPQMVYLQQHRPLTIRPLDRYYQQGQQAATAISTQPQMMAYQQHGYHQQGQQTATTISAQPQMAHQPQMRHQPHIAHMTNQLRMAHQTQISQQQPQISQQPQMRHQPHMTNQLRMTHQTQISQQPPISQQPQMRHQPHMRNQSRMTHQTQISQQRQPQISQQPQIAQQQQISQKPQSAQQQVSTIISEPQMAYEPHKPLDRYYSPRRMEYEHVQVSVTNERNDDEMSHLSYPEEYDYGLDNINDVLW